MCKELHQILLRLGFCFIAERRRAARLQRKLMGVMKGEYQKTYVTSQGDFEVALYLYSDPHTSLPIARVNGFPNELEGKLVPHISHEGLICYVDEMEGDWDPNNLERLYKAIDSQILKALVDATNALSNKNIEERELEGEFGNYWKPQFSLYLLSRMEDLNLDCAFQTKRKKSGEELYALSGDEALSCQGVERWFELYGYSMEEVEKIKLAAHFVKVNPQKLTGMSWPPCSLGEVLDWLADTDCRARDALIHKILSEKVKRRIILLDVARQGLLSIYLELDLRRVDLKKWQRPQQRKMQHLVPLLRASNTSLNFKRLRVVRCDKDSLFSRNSQRADVGNLSGKRIALLGCGTIGGYLADLLFRSGAGCGGHSFDIYDGDSFEPHNFSRHILDASSFGKNKAIALKDKLVNSTHIAKNIRAVDGYFSITSDSLAKYDFIVDATGRPPVSKRLAYIKRTVAKNKQPTLIHAFNDGNGRVSKVFVDAGGSCYGCMLSNSQTHHQEIDHRFVGIDSVSEKKVNCGSTYTPYDASVSLTTAALAQEAVLNLLESEQSWGYSEHSFCSSRTRKPQFISRQSQCRVCSAFK